jgi:uncharacterized alkaline shock family protein YloU
MKGFFTNELGRVYIEPTIISRVCVLPELALSSVFVLPNGPVPKDSIEQLSHKGVDKYVHVDFTEEGKVKVELRLMVRYGPPIRSSAALFQQKVSRRVEASTGLEVAQIDVKIDGIYQPAEPASLPAPPKESEKLRIEGRQESGASS